MGTIVPPVDSVTEDEGEEAKMQCRISYVLHPPRESPRDCDGERLMTEDRKKGVISAAR